MLEPRQITRRAAGFHDNRLDGLTDLVMRARGATVLDIGCNRGGVLFEMFCNGATTVHGVDIDRGCVMVAREWFADFRNVDARFENIDAARGGVAGIDSAFAGEFKTRYDIIIMLDTVHKIRRQIDVQAFEELMRSIARKTGTYFAWRGHPEEAPILDKLMIGFERVHYSKLVPDMNPCGIWQRTVG